MGGQLIEGPGVSRINGFRVPPERLTVIGVDTKHTSRTGPNGHERFDERVLNVHGAITEDDPIVQQMVEIGVIEPVVVEIEESEDGEDRYIVIDGRGRTLRQRIANQILKRRALPPKSIPVFATRKTKETGKLGTTIGIVLNEHRDEDTAMNRASKAQYLLATGYDVSQVATIFRVSEQTVNDWVKLTELTPAAQRAVESGAVSASAAVKLHGLDRAGQNSALEQLIAEGGGKATVKKANAIVQGAKNGGGKGAQPETVVAPSKRAIKKAIEKGKGIISDEIILGMRIAIGDVSPSRVKHLAALLRGEVPSDPAE